MKHYNQQNTEGYTDQELAVLNERFEAILAENGLTEESDNPTLYNWLSEQLLTAYDSEKAQASEEQEEKSFTKITIGQYKGRYFLIGEDGYTTTVKTYNTREAAQKAADRENRLLQAGKNSRMKWEY